MSHRRSLSILVAAFVTAVAGGANAASFAPACTSGVGDAAALVTALTTATTNGEDDTITLGANCIYTLTTPVTTPFGPAGLPELTTDGNHGLTIVGNKATIARLSTAPAFRIAVINGASLTVSNLTFSGGSSDAGTFTDGGAVRLHTGTLDATAVSFVGSTARLDGSGYGGGLAVKAGATAHLHRCGFFSNTAVGGGALYNEGGTVTADNTTLSANSALRDGGGIASGSAASSTTLVNVTIAQNTADRDAADSGSGGGIAVLSGTLSITNSIVARNRDQTPVGGERFFDVRGTFSDGGHNIIGATTGSTGFTVSTLVGTTAAPLDPKLGPVAIYDNDTGSYPPLADSPAVNAADSAVCAAAPINGVDQRGKPRPAGHCDIGTFELGSTITATIAAAPNPAESGAAVTLTCHVAIAPIGPTPASSFTFVEGATTIATASINAEGNAIATLSTLAPGSHDIYCSYAGDPTIGDATSPVLTVVVHAPPTADAGVPPAPPPSNPPSSNPPPPSPSTPSGPAPVDAGSTVSATPTATDAGCSCDMTAFPSRRAPAVGLLALGLLAFRRARRRQ